MDKKISQLTAATTPLTGSELIPIVQSGQTVKATIEDVRGYKVYTALLTQIGGDNIVNISSLDPPLLSIGTTYTITINDGTGDFTNIGAPNNNPGTSFVATGTTPTNWGTPDDVGLSYNTGAPIVTVLENTIGNIWWTYLTAGFYIANSDGLFTAGKVYIDCKNIFGSQVYADLYEDMEESGVPNQLSVVYQQNDGTLVNGFELARVEIRVYP